jgi:sugar O-acyltransferase (sialic acid O-acetyltransferase NeuD family)
MKPELILIGGGGHCKSCIDVIEQENKYKIKGVVDKIENVGNSVLDYKIFAVDNDLPDLVKDNIFFLITLGQIKNPSPRNDLYNKLKQLGAELPTIISPRAYVSRHAKIGDGSIIMHGAIISAASIIGDNCIINTKAIIEHDVSINSFCHISTSAVVNGGAKIGEGTFLGSNSVTKESIIIGENCVIGAGVSVMKNIKSGLIYVGE